MHIFLKKTCDKYLQKAWTVSFLFLTLVKQLEHSGNNIRIF